ncbi:unnamed protein product [Protopolystoma xenopodis]|uniref:CBS domain-containing protein n=1 Tax=Protopolystoma xenopodis TaxID=117903 RepID=A0A448X0E1_9PLAT|nr:unnamed protein product [Protopolystoma xenopodis]
MPELPQPSFMTKTLAELNLGTRKGVATVQAIWPIHRALSLFIEKRVSALPVVDEENKMIDIYAKFDVIVSQLTFITQTYYQQELHFVLNGNIRFCF